MLCPAEHPLDRGKLVSGKKFTGKDIMGELDGDLSDVLRDAPALLPDMLEIFPSDQNKLIISNFLNTVTYNPADSGSVLYKIQLKFLVLVQRIGEFRLVTLHDMEAILLGQQRYFGKDAAHYYYLKVKFLQKYAKFQI